MKEKMSAYEHGRAAFLKGKVCAPALDKAFLAAHVAGNMVVGQSLPALNDWLKGWHDANAETRTD